MSILLSYFILMVLTAVAALLCVAIVRLGKQQSRYDQQLSRTAKTVARLILRNVELDHLLGRSLL